MPQSFVCLPVHVVFSTKHRVPCIEPDWEPRLYEYMGGILREEKRVLLAAGGTADHVHLLISLSKEKAIADVLRVLKANSSKWIHLTIANQTAFAWQTGYAAFGVSYSNRDKVQHYLSIQKEHHHKLTFKEEYLALLRRHGIEYDERYLWEDEIVG